MTYWVPAADRELTSVNSYTGWEQAFRVYMNIFASANPSRITVHLQYNHVIETTATSYPWDNVCKCDCEFRIHMSEHPERNWMVILQQARVLYIKSRHTSNAIINGVMSQGTGQGQGQMMKNICFPYNRGKHTYGF